MDGTPRTLAEMHELAWPLQVRGGILPWNTCRIPHDNPEHSMRRRKRRTPFIKDVYLGRERRYEGHGLSTSTPTP